MIRIGVTKNPYAPGWKFDGSSRGGKRRSIARCHELCPVHNQKRQSHYRGDARAIVDQVERVLQRHHLRMVGLDLAFTPGRS